MEGLTIFVNPSFFTDGKNRSGYYLNNLLSQNSFQYICSLNAIIWNKPRIPN